MPVIGSRKWGEFVGQQADWFANPLSSNKYQVFREATCLTHHSICEKKTYSLTLDSSPASSAGAGAAAGSSGDSSAAQDFQDSRNSQDSMTTFTVDNMPHARDLAWSTSAENTNQLIEHGVAQPDNLSRIGLVRYHLGQWRLKKLQRAAFAREIDLHEPEKENLLKLTLALVNYLKPLELLINNYNPAQESQDQLAYLEGELNALQVRINQIIEKAEGSGFCTKGMRADFSRISDDLLPAYLAKIKNHLFEWSLLNQAQMDQRTSQVEHAASIHVRDNPGLVAQNKIKLELAIKRGKQAQEKIDQVPTIFSHQDLGHFLDQMLSDILILAEHANQNMTTLRGDFHSHIQDAREALKYHSPDLKSPVSPAHQGDLGAQSTQPRMTVLGSSLGILSSEDKINFALVAGHISGAWDYKKFTLNITPFAKWGRVFSEGALSSPGFGLLKNIVFIVRNIIFSPFDLIKESLTGSNIPVFYGCKFFTQRAGMGSAPQDFETIQLFSLLSDLNTAAIPIGTSAGCFIHEVLRNLGSSFIFGLKDGVSDLLSQLLAAITTDLHWGCLRQKHLIALGAHENYFPNKNPEEDRTKEDSPAARRARIESSDAQEKLQSKDKKPVSYGATASAPAPYLFQQPYALRPYHAQGLVPAISSGLTSFYRFFDRNLFSKHSLITGVFFGAYLLAGLTLWNPVLLKHIIGHGPTAMSFTYFCQTIGNAFANGAFSAGIAVGFTFAKVSSGVLEVILHGTSSWLAKAVKLFAHDPGKYMAMIFMAAGFGYIVAEKLSIPFLSQHLKDDAGTEPFLAYFFAGLKLLVVLGESLVAKDKEKTAHIPVKSFQELALEVLEQSKGCKLNLMEQEKAKLVINSHGPRVLSQTALAHGSAARASRNSVIGGAGAGARDAQSHMDTIPATGPAITRLDILNKLAQSQAEILKLPRARKRNLAELIRLNFKAQEAEDLIAGFIYPQPERSLVGYTVHGILNYMGLAGRCVLSPISGSAQPWKELARKLESDVVTATLITPLLDVGSLFFSMLERLIRVPADLLMSQVMARVAYGFFNTRGVSDFNYSASAWCYKQQKSFGRKAYFLANKIQERQVHPRLEDLVQRLRVENTWEILQAYEDFSARRVGAGAGLFMGQKIRVFPGSEKTVINPVLAEAGDVYVAIPTGPAVLDRVDQASCCSVLIYSCTTAIADGVSACVSGVARGVSSCTKSVESVAAACF